MKMARSRTNRISVFLITCFLAFSSNAQASIPDLPNFPSLEDFVGGLSGLPQEFKVTDECKGTVSQLNTAYSAVFEPTDCANLQQVLQVFMPSGNGANVDFVALENVIIGSLTYDTSNSNFDISASYTGTIEIIPNVLSISKVNMKIKFTSGTEDQWRYDISGQIIIGTLTVDANVVRDDAGYTLTANSDGSIPLSDISSMFQTGTVIPDSDLNQELTDAQLTTFSIAKPRVKAVVTEGYGILFGGDVVISNWDPISANVLINRGNDGSSPVTISVYTPSIALAKVFNDIFKMDISQVPVVGTAEVQNLALIISTLEVTAPLVSLDLGYKDMFKLPYEKGVKVQCDLSISDVTVSVALTVTASDFVLSISNPGELTLRKIVDEFLKADEQSSAIVEENGQTKLKSWPTFISFDPLSIGLSKLDVEASKAEATWTMKKFDISLFMAEPIILFNDIIRIADLKFDMTWTKGEGDSSAEISGKIEGSVTLGNKEGVTPPKAKIVIPFPVASQDITITFTNFNIHDIAAAFGFDLPDTSVFSFLTRIQLDSVVLTFNEAGKLNKVSVECSLPETWPIYGSFSVGNMKLSINVDNIAGGGDSAVSTRAAAQSSGSEWSFTVSGHIIISTCDILISSTLSGEKLTVEGSGTNCEVSIAQLLDSINVSPSILPSQITSFALSAPAALFILDRANSKTCVGFAATTNLFGNSAGEVVFVSSSTSSAVVAGFAVDSISEVEGLSFLGGLGLSSMVVLFASTPVTLDPYTWRKEVFNQFAPTNKELSSGLMMKARFVPSPDDLMGRLLGEAGEASIDVSLTFPDLEFRLEVNLGDGLPIGDSGAKFVSMGFVVSPAKVGLDLKFSFTMDNADLVFIGAFQISTSGTASISLLMEGRWNEPFGLTGFAITRLALELGINIATLLPKFGLGGDIIVTPPGREELSAGLTLCVDVSNLARSVFEVHFSRLLLFDIANLFLNRDIGLPDDIGNMGFPSETNIYFSPAGADCFSKKYDAGIEIHGKFQIPFLDVYGQADIVIKLKPFSLKADLNMLPINWANGLLKLVSAESDDVGPHLKMNIGSGADFMIDASCKVVIFGASISIDLEINTQRLHFIGVLDLWGLFRCSLEVELVYGTTNPSLRVIGEMKNDLFTKIKERAVSGIRAAARVVDEKFNSARSKVNGARTEVRSLLNSKQWHLDRIADAKRECSNAPWYKKWYICPASGVRIVYHYGVIGGIYVTVGVAEGVLWAAEKFLAGLQGLIKIGLDVLAEVVSIVLTSIDIQYIRFDLNLSSTQKTFNFQARVVVLSRWTFNPQFEIDFTDSGTAQSSINGAGDQVKSSTMNEVE